MQTRIKNNIEDKLPDRLVRELYNVAKVYSRRGVRLFVFGSWVRLTQRDTSDLDIGVLWKDKRDRRLFAQLYKAIQALPTIRKIDLVDMEQVDESFKRKAISEAFMLPE